MALENATEIQELVSTNPEGSDGLSEADDHMRMIKLCLQNSLPNMAAPWDVNGNISTNFPTSYRHVVTKGYLEQNAAYALGIPFLWMLDALPVFTGMEFSDLDGRLLNRVNYSRLFDMYGTTYGNSDETNFGIPNMMGRFMRVWADGAGADPDRASRGARPDGATGDVVGTIQGDAIRNITGEFTSKYKGGQAVDRDIILNESSAFEDAGEDNTFNALQLAEQNFYGSGKKTRFNADNVVPTGSDNRPKNTYVRLIMRIK